MSELQEASRIWVITGGTRGVGLAAARKAASRDDKAVVLARSVEDFADDDVEAAIACDVASDRSVARAIDEVAERYGRIDVLVNNAGSHKGGRIDVLDPADWQDVSGVNLSGPFHVTRHAIGLMAEGGSVVNVGAVVGLRGFSGDAAYGASKAGLAGLTNVLAVELAPRGIRVNLILPGFVSTQMTEGLTGAARRKILDSIPLGREGSVEEIAEVIFWVAGATYMTGSIVATDGGLMCRL